MARRVRGDEPGSVFHIFNRGVGKRSVFENRGDVRYFLSRLARERRRGRLLIHAYVVVPNHFHLLAESPLGAASEAMRIVQNQYVRRFNRLRRRDGPLFRGRFGSKRVRSEQYWWTLLRYIDLHSVRTDSSMGEGGHPRGSAYHYLRRDGPRWLTRSRIEKLLTEAAGLVRYEPQLYENVLARPLTSAERELVELRMVGSVDQPDTFDDLVTGGQTEVRKWMMNKASNADGTRPGLAVLSPSAVFREVAGRSREAPDWRITPRRRAQCGWDLLLVGLLRDACGQSYQEIAARLSISKACAESRLRVHRKLVREDRDYSTEAENVVTVCIADIRRTTS